MKTKILLSVITFMTLAETAAAQIGLDPQRINDPNRPSRGIRVNVNDPASTVGLIIQNIILLLFTIGALGFLIMFLWGAVNWILSGGDKEKIAGGRRRITTGIIGLVLLSLTFVASQVVGQILGIDALSTLKFTIPRLTQ